ncbi:MAG: hypothetical protein ABII01_06490 [Candidatus Woesearchaeota archaeon]
MKGKRGQEYLRDVALAIFIGLILLAVGAKLYDDFKNTGDREVCRLSVIGKTSTKPIFGGESPIFKKLKCKTHNIQVKENGIFKNGKRIESFNVNSVDNEAELADVQDKTIKVIADQMYDCWYQFKEADPFGQYNANLRCIVCAHITFDEKYQEKVEYLPNFWGHLALYKNNDDTSYLNYLSNGRIGDDFNFEEDVNLLTEVPFSLVFYTSKDNNFIEAVTLGLLGGARTGPGQALAGALINKGSSVVAKSAGLSGLVAVENIGGTIGSEAVSFVKTGASSYTKFGGPGGTVMVTSPEKAAAWLAGKGATGISLTTKAGKVISFAGRAVGKVAWVLTVALLVYDLYTEEEASLYGIEIAPSEEVARCDQFY